MVMLAEDEHVVVLDARGRPAGTVPKCQVHSRSTPLHLAFSCYVVDPCGRVLLSRRAETKRMWPGVWSNACCGHPQWGESLRRAVVRRLDEELAVRPDRLDLALPDFSYKAAMPDGTVEHELCPVVVAQVSTVPRPDLDEVSAVTWTDWDDLRRRAAVCPESLSPWSVTQIAALHQAGWRPGMWPAAEELLDLIPLTAGADVTSSVDPVSPVSRRLDDVLRPFLAGKAAELRRVDPALEPLVGEIGGLLGSGGKRLRPAFVHWGNRAVGGDGEVYAVGAAVEMLHTFALLHDDVMDRSGRRRGRESAHIALARHHLESGMAGDAERFGVNAAILAGDLAFSWTEELLALSGLAAEALDRVRSVLCTLRTEVLAGQYLDLVLGGSPESTEAQARRVALLKSARYTVTHPLLLGAVTAGPEPGSMLCRLSTYGDSVGVAFQLRDDVLGLCGDPGSTGKGTLEDLREGKRTLLILRALRMAEPGQRTVIEEALGDSGLDEDRAAKVRAAVEATGAVASVELSIAAEVSKARKAVAGVAEPARGALLALADMATSRVR